MRRGWRVVHDGAATVLRRNIDVGVRVDGGRRGVNHGDVERIAGRVAVFVGRRAVHRGRPQRERVARVGVGGDGDGPVDQIGGGGGEVHGGTVGLRRRHRPVLWKVEGGGRGVLHGDVERTTLGVAACIGRRADHRGRPQRECVARGGVAGDVDGAVDQIGGGGGEVHGR